MVMSDKAVAKAVTVLLIILASISIYSAYVLSNWQ